jgi:hypothetical protein
MIKLWIFVWEKSIAKETWWKQTFQTDKSIETLAIDIE